MPSNSCSSYTEVCNPRDGEYYITLYNGYCSFGDDSAQCDGCGSFIYSITLSKGESNVGGSKAYCYIYVNDALYKSTTVDLDHLSGKYYLYGGTFYSGDKVRPLISVDLKKDYTNTYTAKSIPIRCQQIPCQRNGSISPDSISLVVGGSYNGLSYSGINLNIPAGLRVSNGVVEALLKGTWYLSSDCLNPSCPCSCSVSIPVYVAGLKQTLTYNGPKLCIIGSVYEIQVSFTGLSSFTYVLDKSGGEISGNTIIFHTPGVYNLTVTQAGDNRYDSASVVGNIVVNKKSQVLEYTGPKDFIVGVLQRVSAVSSVGLNNFIVTSASEGITVIGMDVLCIKTGLFTITITERGNDDYETTSIEVALVCGIDNFTPSLTEIISGGSDVKDLKVILCMLRVCLYLQVGSFCVK